MINAHIGHDCKIGNGVVMSNLVQVAGHVEIEDNAIISASCGIVQFVRIGRNAFVAGMTGIATDVLPYSIFEGRHGVYRTINKLGLMRHGFTTEDIHAIHAVYTAFFAKDDDGTTSADRLKKVRKEVKNNKYALDAIDFIENRSQRGVTAKH